MAAKLTPRMKLSAGRLRAAELMPYFCSALVALIPREVMGLGTLGVTKGGVLWWDPLAITDWSVEEVAVALLHEVCHVIRDHAGRFAKMGLQEKDAAHWNYATDCEINDDIESAGLRLPAHDTRWFPQKIGCKPGRMAEEYFHHLREEHNKNKSGGAGKGGQGGGQNQQGDQPGAGDKPGAGHGWCGGCAGRPLPGEGEEDAAGGSQEEGHTPAEMDAIRAETAEKIRQAVAKGRGTVPAGFARWADQVLAPPKVRWQDKLARATRSAVAFKAGAVDYHYGRPGRRQWAFGVGTGKPIFPSMHAPIPEVAVAFDTSGSMGEAELLTGLTEVRSILRAVGAKITFLACDASVHSCAPIVRFQDVSKHFKGGGGTSFKPVFDRVASLRPRPDIVVYVTDGMGDRPDNIPRGVKVIWLLVGSYKTTSMIEGTGEIIEIDDAPKSED